MDDLLEIIKVVAIGISKTGNFIDILYYDSHTIEWCYRDSEEIIKSQILIAGESRVKGRLYWINDDNYKDKNIFYLEDVSILDHDLFDLSDKND